MKPTTRLFATIGTILCATTSAHLSMQWYRTRKITPELRNPTLLKHPIWDTIELWRRSYPTYASQHLEPRHSTRNLTGIRLHSHNIPGYNGGPPIPIRHYEPPQPRTETTILWLHNGGYVRGTPEAEDNICAHIARTLNCTVISTDYRLAGTAPYPAALHDAHATYTWMQQNYNPNRIVIAGAGAGGGLAACLTQWLHDTNNTPAFQLLIEPMLDDRTRVTPNPGRGEFTWGQTNNTLAWNCYLSHLSCHDEFPNYAAASRRLDLTGLPPTYLAVGDLDLFYEEDLTYVRRLKEQGVAVTSMILPGAYHGALTKHLQAQIVQDAWAKAFDALRDAGLG